MKLTLTESAKKFIDTLDDTDRAKLIFTENTVESNDKNISNKFFDYAKARLDATASKINTINSEVQAEHPEYFK